MKIHIFQIYYNDETKALLDSSFIPYHNPVKDNYFENSVMMDIYDKKINCDFIGVTSPRFREKTNMSGLSIIKAVKENQDKDVIIYSPEYYDKKVNIWKLHLKNQIYKTAEILNNKKYLPFDIFEKNWTYCFCNYWIAKKEIFDDYILSVLKPTMEIMRTDEFKKEITQFNNFKHREKIYPVEVFVLEGLFGTYLSNNNYKVISL